MARTKLAEQYVRFSVDGLQKAEADTAQTVRKVSSTWLGLGPQIMSGIGRIGSGIVGAFRGVAALPAMAGQAGSAAFSILTAGLARVRAGLSAAAAAGVGFVRGLAAFAAPAAGLLAFARTAAQGTMEGQRLATAWEYAGRTIGQIFAPEVRLLSTMLVRAADAFANLSPETKQWIAIVALGAAGVVGLAGAVTVASIAFGGLATAAGIAWAVVTSPITLTIAAIVAVGAAVALLIGYLTSGSKDAAESINQSSQSWIGYLLDGAKWLATAFGEFFNWVMRQANSLTNWMAEQFIFIKEQLGQVPAGTYAKIQELKKAGLLQPVEIFPRINVEAMAAAFDKAKEKADKLIPSLKDIRKWFVGLGDIPGLFKDLFKSGGEMKFRPQLEARFEGLQGTFDRLQEAFAQGTKEDDLKQIRENGKETNRILDQILNKLGLGGAAVGP